MKTYVFRCNRWFAKDEDDGQIIRELIPEKVIEEKHDKSGYLPVREQEVKDRLESIKKKKKFCSLKTKILLFFSSETVYS